MRATLYPAIDALPETCLALLAAAGREEFYHSRPWYEALLDTTLDEGDRVVLCGVEDADGSRARALFVMRLRPPAGRFAPRAAHLFENVYTMVAGPALWPDEPDVGAVMRAFAGGLRSCLPGVGMFRFGSMDAGAPAFDALESALASAGMLVHRAVSFGNWYADTGGCGYEDYMKARSGKMRNLLRRRGRKLEQAGEVRWRFAGGSAGYDDLDALIRDYETVHDSSWKGPELYPAFMRRFLSACRETDALRLGVVYLGDRPIAAQIWTVANRKATIYKLSYDERVKDLSAGSVLTARMMEWVLEKDSPRIVDFGFGDDPYKKDWLPLRRERMALVAFNPRSAGGALAAGKHYLRQAAKRLLRR